MHHLLEQVRRHRVNVDGNVSTVLVTTLVLEVYFYLLHLYETFKVLIPKEPKIGNELKV